MRPLTFLYEIQRSTTFFIYSVVFATFSCEVNFLNSCYVFQMERMINHYLLGCGFLPFALLIWHTQISGVRYPVVIMVYIYGCTQTRWA